jgi:hypothetical protein
MERGPESERVPESAESCVAELLRWIAYERDAAWAAKLAILRMQTRDDIALFGTFLREHDRHAEELAQLVRAAAPGHDIPDEPPFITREALVIGALDRDEAVIAAMRAIEGARIMRYERRERRVEGEPSSLMDALLERHRVDAQARLVALKRRMGRVCLGREAAA